MKKILIATLICVPIWFTAASAQVVKSVTFRKTLTASTAAVLDTFYVTKPPIGGNASYDTTNAIAVGKWAHYDGDQFLFVRLVSGSTTLDSIYVETKNVDPSGYVVDNDSTYAFGGVSTQTSLAVNKPKGGPLTGLDGGPPALALIVTLDTAGTFRIEFTVVFRSSVEYRR